MEPYAATEHFHLLFLGQLTKRVAPELFAVKGGCNLRFYLRSVRYSEDIDLDLHKVSLETLRSNVRTILKSRSLTDTLHATGIRIVKSSEPKQTQTTQRWKLSLLVDGLEREIPTKIEFSRRDGIEGAVMEPISPEILTSHKLYPFAAFHYPRSWAVRQKIAALIGRTQTQARDVFDLSFLLNDELDRTGYALSSVEVKTASEHALSLSFDDYRSQVVAFLLPEFQSLYGTEQQWNRMIASVLDFLQKVGHEST